MAGFRNQSFDDRDTNSLQYQGFWFHEGTWNASNIGQTGTLSSSNDLSASIKFVFPTQAVGFFYYGIPRSRGGMYGICVDCDPNAQNFQTIDAVNATDDGRNPPVVLFSTQFPTPGVHEIILRNQPDPRFPNNNSQITIDRFDIEVVDPNAPPPSPAPAPTVSLPHTQTTTPTPTQTAPALPVMTPAPSKAPVGAIVGGVIGGLVVLLVVLFTWYWCWRKKQKNKKSDQHGFDPPPITNQPRQSTGQMTETQTGTTRPAVPRKEKSVGAQRRGDYQSHPSLGSSSDWTLTAASSRRVVQREIDAGPVADSEDTEIEALPPDYEQIVGVGSSGRRVRSGLGPHAVREGSGRGLQSTGSKA